MTIWQSILTSVILPRIQSNPFGRWISQSHLLGSPIIVEESDSSEQPSFSTERPNREDFNVTSQKFNALVKEIHINIATSAKWLRFYWGKSNISHKTLHHIIISALNNDLTIATDASVKYGRVAHAFCYATLKKGNVLFSTGSKVPGPHRFYRAEIASIMSVISLIDIILTTAGIQSQPITLHTDSETSITTATNLYLNTLRYLISNDIDVALQLQHVCETNTDN